MLLFSFAVFYRKYSFWVSFAQNIKIVKFCWNLVVNLIRIYRNQWWCSIFCIWPKIPFLGKFGPKIKIVNLIKLKFEIQTNSDIQIPWWGKFGQKLKIISLTEYLNMQNLMVMLIFPLSTGNTFFVQCWTQNSILLKVKFSTQTNSNMQNSMVMFSFSVLDRKYPGYIWSRKIKIVSFS